MIIISLVVALSAFVFQGLSNHRWMPYFSYGYLFYLMYLLWRRNKNIYHVEFDDEFLYLILRKNDILIPLENVKDVNIKTLGGVYQVDLYNAEQVGNKFYFKPSLLYPFNHKKKHELVNVLWSKIEKAKIKQQYFQKNSLHS